MCFLLAVLQFLSIGPDLIAIWGLKAKKYLAVDNKGKIFATEAERKECVFREFFGKNFYNIFRTCHSDADGKGWYLSVDENGRITAEKVSYSDEPRLHFIVKTLKDQEENEVKEKDPADTLKSQNSNKRCDKKTAKDFGLPSSEIVWIMQQPYHFEGSMSSTPSPPSSSCVSGSSASTGEWTGSGEYSTSV